MNTYAVRLCVYDHYKYFTLSAWGPTLDVRILRLLKSKSDLYRSQSLTSKVGPHAEIVHVNCKREIGYGVGTNGGSLWP